MGHSDNGPQVAANTVIGRIVYQHSHGVGMFGNGFGNLIPPHSQGDAQALIHLRIDIHRNRAAQNQCVDDAFMDVARQDDFIPTLAGGQYHTLYGAGGSAHHEKSLGRAKGVRRQFFRLPDHRYRVAEIVQGLHAVYIHPHALLTQESG